MKHCLILTGGSLDLEFAGTVLKKESFQKIIAVDGGLKYALELGLIPDVIVGDFDTVERPVLEHYRSFEHIVWDTHPAQKDATDTELALLKARALGCSRILVLGALGGRADHMLGNIHLLLPCLQSGVETCLLDPQNRIYLIDGEHEFCRGDLWGKYISFLPLTETVKDITLEGFRYPLDHRDIQIGTSLCISNELEAERGKITFSEGVLICVEAHD